jgi:hypothetical protein|nr:hypothetical protein [uncultured Methylobacterium sp.]
MADHPSDASSGVTSRQLSAMNEQLSTWAACSADESPTLIEQFEAMGYEVRGKSREQVAEVLRHPPTRPHTS